MKEREKEHHLANAIRIAIRICHGAAVVSGELVCVDLFEDGVSPMRSVVACQDFHFIGSGFVQERVDQSNSDVKYFRCCGNRRETRKRKENGNDKKRERQSVNTKGKSYG